jgi:UDPglucose 6-dehydrogenase
MKILIAGYGFVGKAQELVLKDYHDVTIYDPYLGYKDYPLDVDAIIVCVSTPPRRDGSCEMTNVFEVIDASPDVPILIKSTISVEGWEMIVDAFPNKQICFSPEFLRQNTWEKDALIDHMYIGGNCNHFWSDIFITARGKLTVEIESPAELVAAKAFRNSFLATKVTFFNQIYDYCKAYNLDYDSVSKAVGADMRIGNSHTQITEERGFGGHCFPKDTKAIVRSAQRNNTRLTLIEESINYNNAVRKDNI